MKKLTFLLIFSFLFANINEAIEAFKHKNYKKSFEMFSKIKSPKAYYYLAKHYYYGYGVKKDINKALKYTQIACNEGEGNACYGVGWIYQHDKKDLDVALSYYIRACRMNIAKACYGVGLIYQYDKEDLDVALSYFLRACKMYLAKACNKAGIIYYNKKDYKNAVKYYKRACDLGHSWGCSNLAWHYNYGKGVEKNIEMIYKYAKKAYELNNKNSLKLGYYYDKYVKDYDKAFKYYKIACDNNNSVACSNISGLIVSKKIKNAKLGDAKFYAKKAMQIDPKNSSAYNDLGIYYNKIYNYELAFKNYKIACDMNNSWGCSNLAWFYSNGKYVAKDKAIALKYYEKSCKLGNKESCEKLVIYGYEIYKKNDYPKAAFLFDLACKNGAIYGCRNLGVLYLNGEGVEKNLTKAKELFLYGCNNKIPNACLDVGLFYVNYPVYKNVELAKKYFKKACKLGMEKGCKNYKLLLKMERNKNQKKGIDAISATIYLMNDFFIKK